MFLLQRYKQIFVLQIKNTKKNLYLIVFNTNIYLYLY
nr:MAG TPA: hypothetical protein [Caudoviricetes sp.]